MAFESEHGLAVPVGHAAVVERTITIGGRPRRAGYVEGVATAVTHRRRGVGSALMAEIASIVRGRFELGVLSAAIPAFYERLGWERWRGPSYVEDDGGLVRTEDEDDGILVLADGELDRTLAIACRCRAADDW